MSKIGTENIVNTQKLYDQTLAQSVTLKNGGFVTAWVDWATSSDMTVADKSWSGIKAQVFDSSGVKIGTEIAVNTATLNWQQDPHVTVLEGGNFVVTWTDGWDYFTYADHPGSQGVGGATGDKEGKAIKAQIYTAAGNAIGSEILVNTETRSSQSVEKITALGNGNFVIAWEDWALSNTYAADGSLYSSGGGPGIKAQIFNSTGARIGTEMAVTGSYNYSPQIATLANGGYVITWIDGHYSVEDVRAQLFSNAGSKVGGEILVNTAGTGPTFSTQNEAQPVALSNGNVAIVWTDRNGDDSSSGVKAQIIDSAGGKIGTEFLVNTATLGYQEHPRSSALENGGFVVTWVNWAGANTSSGITANAQVFDTLGNKIGTEILVNTTPAGSIDSIDVSTLTDGSFAVTWSDGYEVRYQVFDGTGRKIGSEVLANTTIEGGQTGPQITALDDLKFVVSWNDNLYGPSDGSGSAVKNQVFSADQSLNDLFSGGPGNDRFASDPGNDVFDGSASIDTVVYAGLRSDFSFNVNSTNFVLTDNKGSAGTDTLTRIERLQFSDKSIALDLTPDGNAGQAMEFIGVIAPVLLDSAPIRGLIISLFDQGNTMEGLCQLALDLNLAPKASNADLANAIFSNVTGGGTASHELTTALVGYIEGHGQANFLATVAGMHINVDLVGLQQTGIEYTI